MQKLFILVVEDDPLCRKILETQLSEHIVDFACDFPSACEKIKSGRYDLCFIDLKLGEQDTASGLELIALAAAKGMYSVVMSGHDAEPVVERAYALGCNDFYAKGNEESSVRQIIARFLQLRRQSQIARLFTENFITEDPSTRANIIEALQYAPSDLPILILGPSGTGKTSLASIIHEHSGRKGNFVSINCAAYTEDLLEAELFGYRKGAFTGANDTRKGKLLLADQGTLFLDEVGSMSLKMQTKLLKAIEEKSFYPLGSDRLEQSQFRLISATLENIQVLIKEGKLRFDFFQRIHGFTINLKPLTERNCDIFPLIEYFTRGGKRLSFSPEAKEAILNHNWPGNVRELKKFVDLLCAGSEGRIRAERAQKLLRMVQAIQNNNQNDAAALVTEYQYRLALRQGLKVTLNQIAQAIIRRNLSTHQGRKTQVLTDLKISTRTLYTALRRQNPQEKELA